MINVDAYLETAHIDKSGISLLKQARLEATNRNCIYVGTEDLLLGFVGDKSNHEETRERKFLQSLGITPWTVRRETSFLLSTYQGGERENVSSGADHFTPRASKVLELAWATTKKAGQKIPNLKMNSFHIFYGMVLEGEGIAAGVLDQLGISELRLELEGLDETNISDPENSPRRYTEAMNRFKYALEKADPETRIRLIDLLSNLSDLASKAK